MTAVTFGDFARQVDEQLAAALACPAGPADVVAARELGRVMTAMARYLDDRVPGYAVESVSTVDMPPWQRAVIDARTAIRWAASCVREGIGTTSDPEPGPGAVLAGRLAEAATFMMAGRDVLQTHLPAAPGDPPVDRSPWAPVVTSQPVTRALAGLIARWAGQVALLAARLASACAASPAHPAELAEGLQAAAQWLWLAQTAVRPAQAADPVSGDDQRLLAAISLARGVRRVPPGGDESPARLCAGITVSAERLRVAVLVTAQRGPWAPVTADAWRWSATAAAVTGQAAEHLLWALTSQPGPLAVHLAQLQQAAETVQQAGMAWRLAAAWWRG
jgi:hypothetical protein